MSTESGRTSMPAGDRFPLPMTTSDRGTRRPHRPPRRVRLTRTIVVLVALAIVATAVAYGVRSLTGHRTVADSCTVVGQTTGTIYAMDPEQLLNASIIADVAMRRALPAQAVTVALATAQQESKLRNLDYGDRDSVGLFQQRPSQGWGPKEQLLDPVYASGKFFDALVKVHNWQSLTVAAAAQAVQHSGFPDAYASWQQLATAVGAALTGTTSGQLTCRLGRPGVQVKQASSGSSASPPAATSVTGAVSILTTALATDLEVTSPSVASPTTKTSTITVSGLEPVATGPDSTAKHRTSTVAAWALAHATDGITRVVVGGQEWRPDRDGWRRTAEPAGLGAVVITVTAR
jgi:hypothetical protein